MTQRKYWAVRTSRDHQDFIFKELEQGRLRQGWGYHERLNARDLWNKGWDALEDGEERAAWPNWRLAVPENGGVKIGDIILAPNLPEDGKFCLAEVIGEYSFQIPEEIEDFGHILQVKLLTPNGVANRNRHVDASIRHTLRARNRMWSLDYYKGYIDKLIEKADEGENLQEANDPKEALAEAVGRAGDPIREALWQEVQHVLQAAEWEEPLRQALSRIYPGADVQAHGGPNEQGKDLLIEWPNPFDRKRPFVIPIQVKNYEDTHDNTEALDQIEQAVNDLKENNIVLAGILLSTADNFGPTFKEKLEATPERIGVPVIAALRPQILDILLAAHLAMSIPAAPE